MEYLGYFLILVVIAIMASGVRIIKEQSVAIVESFGKFSRTLSPGLNLIIPMVENIRYVVNLKIQEVCAEVEVKTKDNMFVKLPITIMVAPDVNNVEDSFYKLQDPESQISSWVLNSVRSIVSNMSTESLFEDREHICSSIKKDMGEKLKSYGYKLEDVLVDQPNVRDEVKHSFVRVVAAKREAEAAQQEGEAAKIKAIAIANAEAESQRIRAQGMADARAILARGLKESIEQFKESDVDASHVMEVLVGLNRLDVLRDVGQKGNTIVLDLQSDRRDKSDVLMGLLAQKEKKDKN